MPRPTLPRAFLEHTQWCFDALGMVKEVGEETRAKVFERFLAFRWLQHILSVHYGDPERWKAAAIIYQRETLADPELDPWPIVDQLTAEDTPTDA